MRNGRTYILIAFMGVGGMLYGCVMTAKAEPYQSVVEVSPAGYIVFSVGDTVWEYDFASEERRSLYRHDGWLSSPLLQVDEASFITIAGIDRMLLVKSDGKAHFLGKGRDPAFFPTHDKLLFFAIPSGKTSPHLYEATLRGHQLESWSVIAKANASVAFPISDDELLFREGILRKYDLRTGELIDLPIRDCWPKVWRSKTKEIICYDEKEKKDVFVNLNGHKRFAPKAMDGIDESIYVAQGDYVLGGQTRWNWAWMRSGEVIDLVLYDFSTDTVRRLAQKITIGSPSNAFWTPDRMNME